MSNLMIGNISRYYQTIISRINTPEIEQCVFNKHALNKDLVTGFGTIIYNVNQRGFYGIIDENGNKYFPINGKQFAQLFYDRKQIQFSLRLHPEISNMYRWGKTANVVALQILD